MAAEQLADKEDQFKRRARRRLVGAVALVLLMITVLPMVLDDRSGQKSSQPEIAISIPSQDGPEFTSKIVPVAPTPAATPAPPVSIASPVEPPPAAKAVAPAVEEKPVAMAPPTEAEAPSPVKEMPKPAEADSPVKAPVPKPVEITQKDKPASVTKGSISVQIGVFSDAAKVRQIRAKIADNGIQCYTENMSTPKGTKYRVRCGPYAGKPPAQQALDKLKTMGFNGILVTNQ